MRSLSIVALSAAALSFACTETATGPDLVGVWQVTAHTENNTGCTPGPAVVDPPYLEFTQQELFGQTYFQWAPCTSPTTCEMPNGLFGLSYAAPIPDGWEAQIYITSGDMTACTLGATVSTAVVGADGTLTITTRISERTGVTGTACETDEAQAALEANQMTCIGLEVITASRI